MIFNMVQIYRVNKKTTDPHTLLYFHCFSLVFFIHSVEESHCMPDILKCRLKGIDQSVLRVNAYRLSKKQRNS